MGFLDELSSIVTRFTRSGWPEKITEPADVTFLFPQKTDLGKICNVIQGVRAAHEDVPDVLPVQAGVRFGKGRIHKVSETAVPAIVATSLEKMGVDFHMACHEGCQDVDVLVKQLPGSLPAIQTCAL